MVKKSNPLKEGLKRARGSSPPSEDNLELEAKIKARQEETPQRNKRGRPPGRKSDPNQTQAAGYVDRDLLLDVQESFFPLKRRFKKRSQVNLSVLISTLFHLWMDLDLDEQEKLLRKYGEISDSDK